MGSLLNSFKLKLLISFLIAAICPFAASLALTYYTADLKMQTDFKNMNHTYAQSRMEKIRLTLGNQEQTLRTIAKAYPYIGTSINDTTPYLKEQLAANPQFLNLFLIQSDGTIQPHDVLTKPLKDYSKLSSYASAARRNGLTWLEPYTDIVSGKRCVGLAMPVTGAGTQIEGVLIANISIENFLKMLGTEKGQDQAQAYIINPSGDIRLALGGGYNTTANLRDGDFILEPVADVVMYMNEGYREFESAGRRWISVFSVINASGWKIVTLTDVDSFYNGLHVVNKDTKLLLLYLGIASVLFAILASFVLSHSISEPLVALKNRAKAIAAGNLDSRIDMPGVNEIRELAEAFNVMSLNLKKTYVELLKRTEELNVNNEQMQQANLELEASYEQLEATMVQLNESEEKHRLLLHNISDMVFVANSEDRLVYVNSSAEKILGYEERELIGKPVSSIMESSYPGFRELLDAKYDYYVYRKELTKKDGSRILAEGSMKRVMEEDRVVGIQAIARDVTQRKVMEDQLQKKYEELQALIRISKAVTSTMDLTSVLNGVVSQVASISDAVMCTIRLTDEKNPYLLNLKAAKGENLEGLNMNPKDSRYDPIGLALRKGRTEVIELREGGFPDEYMERLYREAQGKYLIMIPFIVKSKAIGVMSTVVKKLPGPDQIEFLNLLSNNLAVAIDNAIVYDNLKRAYLQTVQSLVSVVEAKDVYTESHSVRVAKYASFIASEMNYTKGFVEDIWVAGVLHDIGKIGISDAILNKNGPLTAEEYEVVKQHPDIAYRIVSKIGLDEDILRAIRYHHERYDGTGYPERLTAAEIPMMSAIISVADAFDAITSDRPYHHAKSMRQGISEIIHNKGTQFHPQVVDAVEAVFRMKPEVLERIYRNEEIEFF